MVLIGPLIKPDPETASPFQQFIARVTSQVLPRLEIGESMYCLIDEVTSDEVQKFIHLDFIFYHNINLKVERETLRRDHLRYHGGLKALTGSTMLEGMNSLEQNYSDVTTPYLLILGSEDKLSYIDGSKVYFMSQSPNIFDDNIPFLSLSCVGVSRVVG